MDINFYVHNVLLSNGNVENLARHICDSECQLGAYDELHPDDQEAYMETAELALQFLRNQLMEFKADF